MNTIIKALGLLTAVALAGSTLLAETAPTAPSNRTAPISAELAKTCRALAIKAHPTQPAGSRTASTGLFPRVCSQRRQHAKRDPGKVTLLIPNLPKRGCGVCRRAFVQSLLRWR